MVRRVLFGLFVVLLLVLLVAALVVGYLWWRVPSDSLQPLQPGKLTVDGAAVGTRSFGGFDAVIGDDSVTITRQVDDAVIWRNDPGTAFVSASVGRLGFTERFSSFWVDVERDAIMPEQLISAADADGALVLRGTVSGQDTADYTATFTPTKSGAMQVEVEVADTQSGRPVSSLMITTGRDAGESVHGLGEQYRAFDLDGSITPILPREQGIGRGEQPITFLADLTNWAGGNVATTYAAWPSWVTDANRAVELADTQAAGAFAVADLTDDLQARLESWSSRVTANLYVGKSPTNVLTLRDAGRERPPLADWVQQGAILGLQGGTQRVERIVEEMLDAGTVLTGVWLQDWTGQRTTSFGERLWWTWQLDQQRYPGWDAMVASLEARGIKVLTYINPWLVDASGKGDARIRNLYAEAESAGYLVKTGDGLPYLMDQNGFAAALMDFTNPAARDWYADVIANEVLGAGAAGFMADFGEGLPYDGVLYEGTPATEHNRYPQLWAQVVRQGCLRAGKPDCAAFMRSAYLASSQSTPMLWAGDQLVTYSDQDGLASAVLGMHAGGVSGSPLWHSDIGGYTSIDAVVKDYVRPPDINQRWAEMEAFGVMMRTHEGNRPAHNAQVYDSPESRAAFARMSRVYAALAPYRKTVVDEAVETGLPARRHTWLMYPESAAADADLQFFLGAHLLVAPVVAQVATSVSVSFPPGSWVHVLTGERYDGDRTTDVPAPLGTPAAFVRVGDPVGEQIIEALRPVR